MEELISLKSVWKVFKVCQEKGGEGGEKEGDERSQKQVAKVENVSPSILSSIWAY